MSRKYDGFKLLEFIDEVKLSSFTVSEVTTQLLDKKPTQFNCPKNTRQFVHRRLKRLSFEGKVETVSLSNSKAFVYKVVSHANQIDDGNDDKGQELGKAIQSTLLEKIRECKTEMLTCIGEAEALNEWSLLVPELPSDLKERYQATKERTAILLGKVNVFESLLNKYRG